MINIRTLKLLLLYAMALLVFSDAREAAATPASRTDDSPLPPHIAQRLRDLTTKRGLINLTRAVRSNQSIMRLNPQGAPPVGGTEIQGRRLIPVLMGTFSNTPNDPYPIADLQRELFDGPSSTGTMTDFYTEISYGSLKVTGTVFPWRKASKPDSFYTGGIMPNGDPCNGLCDQAKLGEYLKELLDQNVNQIDFSQYDNDGPDGIPNSGDDDDFVDFVAFVHPGIGGECSNNENIWSHRFTFTGLTGSAYETKSPGKNGRNIRIDDYVIMPAKACDGTTMIQIGVFAHEFGHAFGLPDLYDTQQANGRSEGIGNWGLMGAGSWGGDNRHPEKPSHMSAWEKAFLGWVKPFEVNSDINVVLRPAEEQPDVFKIRISEDEYYLLEYRRKTGFDVSLTGSGLLIWRINEAIAQAGLINNTVNGDQLRKGVGLIEADALMELDRRVNRGNAGDMFPEGGRTKFDSTTNPASVGRIAICDIGSPGTTIRLRIVVSRNTCQ
jgi:M6 family metalloprotease-like protein